MGATGRSRRCSAGTILRDRCATALSTAAYRRRTGHEGSACFQVPPVASHLCAWMGETDVVFPNEIEALHPAHTCSLERAMEALGASGALVVVKRAAGDAGVATNALITVWLLRMLEDHRPNLHVRDPYRHGVAGCKCRPRRANELPDDVPFSRHSSPRYQTLTTTSMLRTPAGPLQLLPPLRCRLTKEVYCR